MLTYRGFQHSITGPDRPQIVMIGNGLERKSGQPSWKEFLKDISAPNCIELTDEQKKELPLPLLYELLSTSFPAPSHISLQGIKEQEKRLSEALEKLKNKSNSLLEQLPTLGADHIFTTNYSYCIENAFWPKLDFSKSYARSTKRFNFSSMNKKGKQIQEGYYRMHSGYLAKIGEEKKHDIGIWHIHGEFLPILIEAPLGPIVVLKPDLEMLTLTPGIIFTDFLNLTPTKQAPIHGYMESVSSEIIIIRNKKAVNAHDIHIKKGH